MMQSLTQWVVYLAVSLILSGCQLLQIKPVEFTETDVVDVDYRTTFTKSGWAPLSNGLYRHKKGAENGEDLVVRISSQRVLADVNNDGHLDIVAILITDPGGIGYYRELSVVLGGEERKALSAVNLGDRTKVQSVTVENQQILVSVLQHDEEDRICCPSQSKQLIYTIVNDELQAVTE
ncbi:hypothetical protein KCM76_06405 [Zooshikella marina]|nr:hypothetical protein [Zooshikella ganghwensis]MBU2705603.1 hypothetical protein [Zooshikella ganghwensis]